MKDLKQEIKEYWNKNVCGTRDIQSPKFSYEYFEEIEKKRYDLEPEVFSFAQFTRYHGKKVLEVGLGSGTDFIQWIRAGAETYGVDLSEESINVVKERLKVYNLNAKELKTADAENLPFESNFFDLVYSWGVVHHTPNTEKAVEEIIRVTKPGGTIKLMVYNRHSIYVLFKYLKYGLFSGKPFRSIADILYYHQESLGTKAYTVKEMKQILSKYPVEIKKIIAPPTSYDLTYSLNFLLKLFARFICCFIKKDRGGWFLQIELTKQ